MSTFDVTMTISPSRPVPQHHRWVFQRHVDTSTSRRRFVCFSSTKHYGQKGNEISEATGQRHQRHHDHWSVCTCMLARYYVLNCCDMLQHIIVDIWHCDRWRVIRHIVIGDVLGHLKYFDTHLKLLNWYQDFHLGPINAISFSYFPDFNNPFKWVLVHRDDLCDVMYTQM